MLAISASWLLPTHLIPWRAFHADLMMAIALLPAALWVALRHAQPVTVPAIALGLARLIGATGIEAAVLVLCAALPTATNAYILAVRMTGDGRAVALQVTVGTVLSMATLPAWMALV